jgi:hypothetical protein
MNGMINLKPFYYFKLIVIALYFALLTSAINTCSLDSFVFCHDKVCNCPEILLYFRVKVTFLRILCLNTRCFTLFAFVYLRKNTKTEMQVVGLSVKQAVKMGWDITG